MKVVSALIAFLALCQFQSAAAAGLRSRAMFLPNIKDALEEAKEKSESLKDAVIKSYEKVEDTTGKVIDTGKDVLEDTKVSVPCDEIWQRVVTCKHRTRSKMWRMTLRTRPRMWAERSRNSLGDADTVLQRIKAPFIPLKACSTRSQYFFKSISLMNQSSSKIIKSSLRDRYPSRMKPYPYPKIPCQFLWSNRSGELLISTLDLVLVLQPATCRLLNAYVLDIRQESRCCYSVALRP